MLLYEGMGPRSVWRTLVASGYPSAPSLVIFSCRTVASLKGQAGLIMPGCRVCTVGLYSGLSQFKVLYLFSHKGGEHRLLVAF